MVEIMSQSQLPRPNSSTNLYTCCSPFWTGAHLNLLDCETWRLLCRLRQMEASVAALPSGSVNPEKLARAAEALSALRDQLTDMRAAEIVLCPKVRGVRPIGCSAINSGLPARRDGPASRRPCISQSARCYRLGPQKAVPMNCVSSCKSAERLDRASCWARPEILLFCAPYACMRCVSPQITVVSNVSALRHKHGECTGG